jgi:hypothetical protein
VDDYNERMTEDDDADERMESERGDDDASDPDDEVDDDSPREAIGYGQGMGKVLHIADKGPSLARGEQIAAPAPNVRGPGVCAQCGRSYAIRMLGECPHCQARRTRQASDALASVIRELKAGRAAPDRERHLVKQLHELGHPHRAEFLAALEARNQAVVSKPRSRL